MVNERRAAGAESAMKWGLITVVTAFGMFIMYKFAKSQGWIAGAKTPTPTRITRGKPRIF